MSLSLIMKIFCLYTTSFQKLGTVYSHSFVSLTCCFYDVMDFEFSSPPLFLMEPLTSVLFLKSDAMGFIWKPTYHCVSMKTEQDFGVQILVSPGLVLNNCVQLRNLICQQSLSHQKQWSQQPSKGVPEIMLNSDMAHLYMVPWVAMWGICQGSEKLQMVVNKIVWVTWKSNIENKIMSVPERI